MQIGEMTLAGQPASIEAARKRVLIMQAGQSGGGCSGSGGAADHGRPSRGDRKTPDRTRVCAEQVLRSFNTWAFKREQPSDLPLMLEVIARAISRSEPLHFVLYWGKGPRCDIAEWDLQCLSFLALFLARVAHVYQPGAALNLVFTDTHARLNGHSRASMNKYFLAVTLAAGQRGFETCRLSALTSNPAIAPLRAPSDELVSATMLSRLTVSARKWYRGPGGPEQGALIYYRTNLVERVAVELAFPHSIFLTFNGSEFRGLFPEHLPIFYMYSLRRGISIKPWFLPEDAIPCDESSCQCFPLMQSA